jgi:phospholipase/carboxylesterase
MRYLQTDDDQAVTVAPKGGSQAAVIWLHGLGADGYDFVPLVPELRLPEELGVRFVFPHAPARPVTINNGFVMRAWYDVKGLSANGPQDEEGIAQSQALLHDFIAREVAQGIDIRRIVIAGFSQGGAIALHSALRHPQRLAGVLALSTYLPLHENLAKEASAANRDVPILMCHGTGDPVLPLQLGEMSRDYLNALGYQVEWHPYPMRHEVCAQEVADISAWLVKRLNGERAP